MRHTATAHSGFPLYTRSYTVHTHACLPTITVASRYARRTRSHIHTYTTPTPVHTHGSPFAMMTTTTTTTTVTIVNCRRCARGCGNDNNWNSPVTYYYSSIPARTHTHSTCMCCRTYTNTHATRRDTTNKNGVLIRKARQ